MICGDCYATCSYTAGSFFRGIRKARAWLAAIWFHENGIQISANKFHKLLQISTSTAWEIFRKLSFVMATVMSDVDGLALVRASDFCDLIGRRSLMTPALCHPSAEVDSFASIYSEEVDGELNAEANDAAENERGNSVDISGSTASPPVGESAHTDTPFDNGMTSKLDAESMDISTGQLPALERIILDCLSTGPLCFDDLSAAVGTSVSNLCVALSSLELSDRIKSDFGGRYSLMASSATAHQKGPAADDSYQLSSGLSSSVLSIISRIQNFAQRVSRKYLQLYISSVCWVDEFELQPPGQLLDLCRGFPKVTRADLLAYCTPPMVLISPGEKL